LAVAFLTRDRKASIARTWPEVNQVLAVGADTLAACTAATLAVADATAALRA